VDMADYVSVDTHGWWDLETLELDSTSAISTSDNYLDYQDIPNQHITKCGVSYPDIGYAGSYNNERELFDVLVTEAYNKHGVCLDYYITSYDKNYDKIRSCL
jgi:hypothetical protein